MNKTTEYLARYLHALGIVLSYGTIIASALGLFMWALWYHTQILAVVVGTLALAGVVHIIADDLPRKG
jgi:hypothetical protein